MKSITYDSTDCVCSSMVYKMEVMFIKSFSLKSNMVNQLINVWSFGTLKLGKTLKKPHIIADALLKKVTGIDRCYIITGDQDILINFKVNTMDDYYEKIWEYGTFLERGFGAIVSKEFLRPLARRTNITVYILGTLQLGSDMKKPEELIGEWFKEFSNMEEVYVITGAWDVLIKLRVNNMQEYFHTTWGIGKYLIRGNGSVVSKTIKE